jgi:hypothetical protein
VPFFLLGENHTSRFSGYPPSLGRECDRFRLQGGRILRPALSESVGPGVKAGDRGESIRSAYNPVNQHNGDFSSTASRPAQQPRAFDYPLQCTPMDCPKCKLVNPPTAKRCDCGYDFETRTVQEPYLTARDKQLSPYTVGIAGVILGIVLLLELILRFTSAAIARHSLALGVLTVILVAGFVRIWFWKGKTVSR